MAKLVSKVYGDALFNLAVEEGRMDLFLDEAHFIANVFEENASLIQILNHPQIAQEEKISMLEKIFKGRVCDDFTGFMVLSVKKDRQNEIIAVLKYLIDKIKEYKKIGVVSVKSATKISDDNKEKIRKRLLETTDYESLEISYETDKSLIGGLVIRIGDRVVDSSIKKKISELSKDLRRIQLD